MVYPFENFRVGISDPRFFFGREDVISEVINSPFQVRVLMGGRRLGKTSVLNAIRWRLLELDDQVGVRALPVLFNLQQERPTSLDNFRYLLIQRLKETIQNPQQEEGFDLAKIYRRFLRNRPDIAVNFGVLKANMPNPGKDQSLDHEYFSQGLSNIIKNLQNNHDCRGVCFLFDGAEYLVKQTWANDACSYLRSLKDTTNLAIKPFLGLFLSGYRDLKDYHQAVSSPLFNIADIQWLGVLSASDTEKLIRYRCQPYKEQLTDDDINKIINLVLEWGGCHPYLSNQMLNIILDSKEKEKAISDEYLTRSLIKQHRKREFTAWWDEDVHSYGFGELEQKVYRALLEENQATAEILVENINLSLNDIEDALTVLAGTGVIHQLDYETYKIGSKLFSQWVIDEKCNSQCQEA
ncbi:helix-turn-helix domain-containing protein [Crocosphaera sp. Alani8]|uniref:helix-turn-helix domain-containing protein n=1 Tax=Crocosphaera sp. Alani8 TaxID=3038952 RepID=UPI00313BF0FC